MLGWAIPPPGEPRKTPAAFDRERALKIEALSRAGYLRSQRMRRALLAVCREDFVPPRTATMRTRKCRSRSRANARRSPGLVVSVEIDPVTFAFAKQNLTRAGYRDLVLVNADGGMGYPPAQPYNKIAVTAACAALPEPLIAQLAVSGRIIAPVNAGATQRLVLGERQPGELQCVEICDVLYIPLRGVFAA